MTGARSARKRVCKAPQAVTPEPGLLSPTSIHVPSVLASGHAGRTTSPGRVFMLPAPEALRPRPCDRRARLWIQVISRKSKFG